MKSYLLCVQCIFILNFCWISVLAEDGSIPSIGASSESENTSSDSVSEEVKIDGGGDAIRDLEPSVDVAGSFDEKIDSDSTFNKQVFAEATSQNSGVANDITTSGQPVVVTLADVATAELQQRAIIPSQDENKEPSNLTQPVETSNDIKPDTNQSRSETNSSQETDKLDILKVKENLTEEIPSFSEWAQKHLEAEKNREPSNTSTQHPIVNGKGKLRWKNYASLDCGAKVVASNPEAVSPSAILSPSRDEYKLNTCTSRIWFIVELCEAIQAKKIDFANFELFSSSPKDFVVSVSDRFPTRDWSNVGQFMAKDERDIQSFDLDPHLFGKYIKVEVKSHYGSEHYCPISLFRVYGTSEFEVLQKEDPVHADRLEEDDDDDDDDEALDVGKGDASKNLFSSATDAVISMVKKAAEVLGNKGNQSNQTVPLNTTKTSMVQAVQFCTSPSHLVVCDNCTDTLFGEVYELLSCHSMQIRNFVQVPLIRDSLVTSNICRLFGLDFCKSATDTIQSNGIKAFFPDRYLGAMCNTIAVVLNKVVLNTTIDYQNDTQSVTDEGSLVNIETSEPHVISLETQKEAEITDTTPTLQATDSLTKSTCSTDVSYTSQIKPTKTLTSDLDLRSSVTETSEDLNLVVTSTETSHSNASEKIVEVVQNGDSEKIMEVESATESVEHLDDVLEQFMDFTDRDHLPNAQTTQTTPQAQKESVFLRLSNRIKALERNMSLSGQYLEELSKRYKKQVEEIQKLLDKTILGMTEESKKKDERNKQLEDRLTVLTTAVEALIAERKSWSSTIYTIIVSSLVTLFILTFCCKIPEPRSLPVKTEVKRRKSLDLVRLPPPQKKKRRPSDQALKIVRSSMETGETQAKRKKRKKQVILKRSNSISTLGEEGKPIWERQESAPPVAPVDWVEGKHFEEVPFVLEESEHSTLEPLVVEAPNFLKTALNSRSARVNGEVTRKSSSLDETGLTANGGFSFSESTPKKERKGFKRIFKKVF